MNLKGQQLINSINTKSFRNVPNFKVGDTVRVFTKIEEGNNKKRIQIFEGLVIRRKGSFITENFTVRKVFSRIGVERIFFVHSSSYEKIELVRSGMVCRSKLYYVRNLSNKAIKIKERKTR